MPQQKSITAFFGKPAASPPRKKPARRVEAVAPDVAAKKLRAADADAPMPDAVKPNVRTVAGMLDDSDEDDELVVRRAKKSRALIDDDDDDDVPMAEAAEAPAAAPADDPAPAASPKEQASPAQSPARSRAKSPAKSPTKARSKSPAKSPARSRAKSPTKSPTKARSKSPPPPDDDDAASSSSSPARKKKKAPAKKGATVSMTKDPIADATWEAGKAVPYAALAAVFADIEATSGRLDITMHLCNFLRTVIATTPGDLLPCLYLATNQVAPAFVGVELGIGESILMKAIAETTGRTIPRLKELYEEHGDLGIVAEGSRARQKTMFAPPKLTVRDVFAALRDIAHEKGTSAQNKKKDRIMRLLVASRGCEARFIVRSLSGRLRIGLQERTVLVALAHAITLTPSRDQPHTGNDLTPADLDDAADVVKQVFNERPSYDDVVPPLLAGGVRHLRKECYLTPGIPVRPMLAKPTKGIREVLDRFSDHTFTCEYKYDGERAQIHLLESGAVHVYSRGMENLTEKYPDVVDLIPKVRNDSVKSFIIDAEAVAVDTESGKILPFQVLSTRARKGVSSDKIQVRVCIYAFDCLYLNGESLLQKPFQDRREAMYASFKPSPSEFTFATHVNASDVDEIQDFLNEAINQSCEGLMVKTLQEDATYEPSKRSLNWLKVKKDYIDGLGDSLDLVPIGAYHGKGKRTGVFGAYLLACFDEDGEEYQSVCKIGTGFSDAQLAELTADLQGSAIDSAPSYYRFADVPGITPDVWFEPSRVWEVKAADLSISPKHMAAIGLVDEGRGIALRFPRFLRVRDDKTPEEATNASQVSDMYRAQAVVGGGGGGGGGDDW